MVVRLQVFIPCNEIPETLYVAAGPKCANPVSMPRASDPNRCRWAELVPGSPPRAARRTASSRGPAPRTPAAAPAAALPAESLTRVHCEDSRIEIVPASFRASACGQGRAGWSRANLSPAHTGRRRVARVRRARGAPGANTLVLAGTTVAANRLAPV